MKRKIEYRCTTCGSTDIRYDAVAEWDIKEQDFALLDTQDGAYCNSDTCMGEECRTVPYDTMAGEELGTAPGTFSYIFKADADAAWAAYTAERMAESILRDRERRQEQTIANNAAVLADAYAQIGA